MKYSLRRAWWLPLSKGILRQSGCAVRDPWESGRVNQLTIWKNVSQVQSALIFALKSPLHQQNHFIIPLLIIKESTSLLRLSMLHHENPGLTVFPWHNTVKGKRVNWLQNRATTIGTSQCQITINARKEPLKAVNWQAGVFFLIYKMSCYIFCMQKQNKTKPRLKKMVPIYGNPGKMQCHGKVWWARVPFKCILASHLSLHRCLKGASQHEVSDQKGMWDSAILLTSHNPPADPWV